MPRQSFHFTAGSAARSPKRSYVIIVNAFLLLAVSVSFAACATAPPKCSGPAGNLTGKYLGNDGAIYFVQQEHKNIYWAGLSLQHPSALGANDFQIGTAFSDVFEGVLAGSSIHGQWVATPRGATTGRGSLALQVRPVSGTSCAAINNIAIVKTGEAGSPFNATQWRYLSAGLGRGMLPGDNCDDFCRFDRAQRNDEGSMADHMSAGGSGPNAGVISDNVVIYGRVDSALRVNYPGYTGAVDIYGRRLGRSYAHFMCADGGAGDAYKWFDGGPFSGPPDGDITFNVNISAYPDLYSNRMAHSFLENPQVPGTALTDVHAELIMYGRDAQRNDCAGDVPTWLPGWADSGSNSVLFDNRPLDGVDPRNVQISGSGCDPGITIDAPLSCRVTSLLGADVGAWPKGALVRVTGVLAKDRHTGPMTPGVEIHPVYSIDLVSPSSSGNLTGTWGDPRTGATYYIREIPTSQTGISRVWWLGMSADRGRSFSDVFSGVAEGNSIVGKLVYLPLGARLGTVTMSLTISGDNRRLYGTAGAERVLLDRLFVTG